MDKGEGVAEHDITAVKAKLAGPIILDPALEDLETEESTGGIGSGGEGKGELSFLWDQHQLLLDQWWTLELGREGRGRELAGKESGGMPGHGFQMMSRALTLLFRFPSVSLLLTLNTRLSSSVEC